MRELITRLPASKIREVADAGMGRDDVLAFWFGESDEVTGLAVREAASASLMRGETFYSPNLGLPELRQALVDYTSRLHKPVSLDRIAVTSSGVSALMIAMQALVSPGDEVLAVVPLWPNLCAQAEIMGARLKRISLRPVDGAWILDLQALLDSITPATRVLLLNAPNNPTGWTLSAEEQRLLLEHCRRTGTWIIADEVYERLYYLAGQPAAPSFLDQAEPDDRLIVVHSFSKSFLMTGWRLGWMVLPSALLAGVAKLIEFNTSCAPVFVQRGGLAALVEADVAVPALRERMRRCRDTLLPALAALPGLQVQSPLGGMYAFFRVPGQEDSLSLAKRLVRDVGLGLAPGAAFGAEGEGWLRWCFASREPSRLLTGVERLARGLGL